MAGWGSGARSFASGVVEAGRRGTVFNLVVNALAMAAELGQRSQLCRSIEMDRICSCSCICTCIYIDIDTAIDSGDMEETYLGAHRRRRRQTNT